jgi:hypothetical protein
MKTFYLILIISFLGSNIKAQLRISTDGKVGIGTDTPSEKLHVNGSLRGNQQAGSLEIKTDFSYTRFGSTNGSFSHFYTNSPGFYFEKSVNSRTGQFTSYTGVDLFLCTSSNNTTRIRISNTNGNVGIGKDPTTYKLDVEGDIASRGVKITSDIRLKDDVKPMDKSFNKIALLQPITFQYKPVIENTVADTASNNISNFETDVDIKTRYGFSAQDVQKIFPELVTEDKDGYLSLDYIGLIPVLVEALKEQQLKIEVLEAKVAALSGKKGTY